MSLGRRIREERKRRKLTQEELAERVGVSQSAVSKWEANAQAPDMASLIKLSAALSMPASWLILAEDEQHPFEKSPAWGNIQVVGAIERWTWVEDPEWDLDDHFEINAPPNLLGPGFPVVGFVIRDDEAAPYFNKDSIVFVSKPDFRMVVLKTGDYVVTAEHDDARDLYEVTIRELREGAPGNFTLHELSPPEDGYSFTYSLKLQLDGSARGTLPNADQLLVIGLVVASFRLEDVLSRLP